MDQLALTSIHHRWLRCVPLAEALFAVDSHDAVALPNLFYEVHLFFGEGSSSRFRPASKK